MNRFIQIDRCPSQDLVQKFPVITNGIHITGTSVSQVFVDKLDPYLNNLNIFRFFSPKETKSFESSRGILQQNHIQGYGRNSKNYPVVKISFNI